MPEPLKETINVGDGITIEVRGQYGDLIWFYRAGIKIAEDNIRDGNDLTPGDFSWRKTDPDGSRYMITVRHGQERDLVYAYALIDSTIIRSPRWRDRTPGPTTVAVEWSSPYFIGIDDRGSLEFDRDSKTWKCTPGPNARCEGDQTVLPRL